MTEGRVTAAYQVDHVVPHKGIQDLSGTNSTTQSLCASTGTKEGGLRCHPSVKIESDCRLAFARLIRELDVDLKSPTVASPPRRFRVCGDAAQGPDPEAAGGSVALARVSSG